MGIFNWTSLFERLSQLRDGSQTERANRRRHLRKPRARVQVETLEDRCLPAASLTGNEAFVNQVYLDLLNHAADPASLSAWSALLDAGVSKSQLVMYIETAPTNEYQADVVNQIFEKLLDRPGDSGDLSSWVPFLDQNGVEVTTAAIAGSQEYFQDAGGTNSGFLSLLYTDLLNRNIDPNTSAVGNMALDSGWSRMQVAMVVLTSPEYRSDVIAADFEQFLHRPADAGDLSSWVAVMNSGFTDQEIIAGIIGSTEFSNDLTVSPSAPTVSSPSTATTTTATSTTIAGTAASGSLVQISKGGTVVGSEQLALGATSYSISVPLAKNSGNSFEVTDTTGSGIQSAPTPVPVITQSTTQATVTVSSTAKSITNVDAIPVTFTFNESVTGFTSSNITVTNGTIADFAGSGTTYTANVLPTADGAVTLSVAANAVDGNTASNTLSITSLRSDPIVTVNPLTSNSTSPTLTGTVSDITSTVSVVVGGETLAATVTGNVWTANLTAPLTAGTYNIAVTATDLAGNASTTTATNALLIETTGPTVTVDTIEDTTSTTPTLMGTVNGPLGIDSLSVTVAGQVLSATVSGNDWTAVIPTALANGTYDITASATDEAGNIGTITNTAGLTVNVSASNTNPVVTVNPLITNRTTPTLSGTVSDSTATVSVLVNGITIAATLNGNVWTADVPNADALAPGSYDIAVTATDSGGTGSVTARGALVIDTSSPSVTANNLDVANTVNQSVILTGTVSNPEAGVSVTVAGATYAATVSDNGVWTANVTNIPSNGTYSYSVTATDPTGNQGTATGTLTIDFTAPIGTLTATANSLTTSSGTPTLTGTVSNSSATVSVVVGGQTLAATVTGNQWSVTPTTLTANTYNISVTATLPASGSTPASTATTTGTLVISSTAPTVTVNTVDDTTTTTPTLTGTVSDLVAVQQVMVNVGGLIFPATLSNGSWSATVPTALANGIYTISASATDAAGNVSSQTGSLTVNVSASTTSQVLTANPLTTKNTLPTLTGTVSDSNASVSVTVGGETLTATVIGNEWSATATSALTPNTYNISVTSTDGTVTQNASASNGLVIDTTNPIVTIITPNNSTSATTTLSGTVSDSVVVKSVIVTVGGQTITAPVNNGSWTAAIPTGLANGTYNISASATDVAGNVGTASATGGLVVDVAPTNTLPFSVSDNAWQTLSSGVRIWDVTTGTGTAAAASSTVTVNYIGYTLNGSTPFNNSFTAGQPLTRPLTGLIVGWQDGIPGMMPGGERRLDIPAALAYGNNPPAGSGIPDGAELFFDINMISIS